ncbi:TPA: anaerobic carbon-monoxide dehydrogenase catalytic subunit [Candidatus Poribacteria bacterium]|nr:anaerobic carbon-monoxide dehydrogenase catalytic subunit [Candidatus Poribacteria bacterium]
MEVEVRSIDSAVEGVLQKAAEEEVTTVWDRLQSQLPQCRFGRTGVCCRICSMGPCRITPRSPRGVCGATADTIAARNFIRMIAGGAAAHSDHGRAVAELFLKAVSGEAPGYEIKDEHKLYQLALDYNVEIGDRKSEEIAKDVAEKVLEEFGKQEGEIQFIKRAPLRRQEIWRELGVVPRGVDREIVEIMHRTTMGVDMDYRNLLLQGIRCALADGWGGSMIATELQDILFGTPVPVAGRANLGVLKRDEVNIIVHGHEPLLSEMVVYATQEEELQKLARDKGAKGINIAGICCTANEVLMRHGIPLAGNVLHQELALVTGVTDTMVVDVQCIMQSLPEVAQCFLTKIVTTSPKAKIPGAIHMEFDEENALEKAKELVYLAIENFPNRKPNAHIPEAQIDLVAGFSHETIAYLLGGLFRASYRPLNDNIINGRIRGVAGIVGCNNPKVTHDSAHVTLVKELIRNDILVLQTGCSAIACAKAGLMVPEAAKEFAGDGLAEVCEAVGIPPVLHMGSCVDNSRILMAATAMVKEGGLGDDISDLPVAGAAPEWMSEKAISIGQYFVASGVFTVFGVTWPTLGSETLTKLLFEEFEDMLKGRWAFEPDPKKQADMIIQHIDEKRKALGIDKARERILFDMAMRRELE